MAPLPIIAIAVLILCLLLVIALCAFAFGERRRLRRWNDRNRRDIAPAGTQATGRPRPVRWFPKRSG